MPAMKFTGNPKTQDFDTWAQQVTYDRRMALLKERETTLDVRLFKDVESFKAALLEEYQAIRARLL